jgi:hypothetical protein
MTRIEAFIFAAPRRSRRLLRNGRATSAAAMVTGLLIAACSTDANKPLAADAAVTTDVPSGSGPTPCDPPRLRATDAQCAPRTMDNASSCTAYVLSMTPVQVLCTHACDPTNTSNTGCEAGFSCDPNELLCFKSCDSDLVCQQFASSTSCKLVSSGGLPISVCKPG